MNYRIIFLVLITALSPCHLWIGAIYVLLSKIQRACACANYIAAAPHKQWNRNSLPSIKTKRFWFYFSQNQLLTCRHSPYILSMMSPSPSHLPKLFGIRFEIFLKFFLEKVCNFSNWEIHGLLLPFLWWLQVWIRLRQHYYLWRTDRQPVLLFRCLLWVCWIYVKHWKQALLVPCSPTSRLLTFWTKLTAFFGRIYLLLCLLGSKTA